MAEHEQSNAWNSLVLSSIWGTLDGRSRSKVSLQERTSGDTGMQEADAMQHGRDSVQGLPPVDSSGRIDGKRGQSRRALASAALATLDKLNRGVVLIDGEARVWFTNLAATTMLRHRSGISLRSGRLEFTGNEASRRFQQYLARAADQDGGESFLLGVAGAPRKGAYRVLVSPLQWSDISAGTAYCVFVYEPGAGHRPLPNKVLAQLYGLTPSESRLVNALFVGKSLGAGARQVGVTVNTAKSVLKSVFEKCGVSSQAELLQLLALGPRTL